MPRCLMISLRHCPGRWFARSSAAGPKKFKPGHGSGSIRNHYLKLPTFAGPPRQIWFLFCCGPQVLITRDLLAGQIGCDTMQ